MNDVFEASRNGKQFTAGKVKMSKNLVNSFISDDRLICKTSPGAPWLASYKVVYFKCRRISPRMKTLVEYFMYIMAASRYKVSKNINFRCGHISDLKFQHSAFNSNLLMKISRSNKKHDSIRSSSQLLVCFLLSTLILQKKTYKSEWNATRNMSWWNY